MPKRNRASEARTWLDSVRPDWVSLQFVPFAFDPRGLCFDLGSWLTAMNSQAPWHIMFHELWLGLGEDATVKDRIWGSLQRKAVLNVTNRLRPGPVHTQTTPYRTVLGREKIKADILPLFSNIPCVSGDGWRDLLEPLVAQATGKPQPGDTLYLAGILGAVHPQWHVGEAVETILPLVQRLKKRLVLVFLGKNNLNQESFDDLRTQLQGRADMVVAGERPAAEISKLLQTLDLGLATTPLEVIQKSGSAAAMLEHGLPLLVIRDDWHLRGTARQNPPASDRLFTPPQFAALETLPGRDPARAGDHGVKKVADQLLSSLASFARNGA